MQCQFDGNRFCLLSIALFFPCPNLLMQALPPARWYSVVEHLLIEGVEKAITCCYSSIGPFGRATGPQELLPSRQLRTPLLYRFYLGATARRHCRSRELDSHHTSHF